jgi:hypothetical protein
MGELEVCSEYPRVSEIVCESGMARLQLAATAAGTRSTDARLSGIATETGAECVTLGPWHTYTQFQQKAIGECGVASRDPQLDTQTTRCRMAVVRRLPGSL